MSDIRNWSTTAGNNNSAAPDGFPENMAPSGVNNAARELMAQIKTLVNALPWIPYGKGDATCTFSITTSGMFIVEGANVSSEYVKGRRVRAIGANTGTIYGTIDTVTFSTDTKVSVLWDSGYLDTADSQSISIFLGLSPIGLPQHRTDGVKSSYVYKNFLINGGFDVWQRGTVSSLTASYKQYLADRWLLQGSSVSTSIGRVAFTPGQTDVPGEPEYYVSIETNSSHSGSEVFSYFWNTIENVYLTAGRKCVLSFYAKAGAAGQNLGILFQQAFGSNGQTAVNVGISTITLTDTWKYYTASIDFPAVPAGTVCATHNTRMYLWLYDGGNSAAIGGASLTMEAKTFCFANFQLEEGVRATPFEKRPFALELELCRRYYQKTYNYDVAPGSVNAANQQDYYMGAGQSVLLMANFYPEMRTAPSMRTYSPNTGAVNKIYSTESSADKDGSWQNTGTKGSNAVLASSTTALQRLYWHWTADADYI